MHKIQSKYFSHVDDLRAIAVILVIAYHCDLELLDGGFIGVDIFFVISGFLITNQVLDYREFNVFTLLEFYAKRIARILPSLLITLWLVLLYGIFYLEPKMFDNLGKEIFYSALGLMNWYYAQGVNYFEIGVEKPLIHMWSLSVEEQFYLIIIPLILIFKRNLLVLKIFVCVVLLISLGFSEYALLTDDKGSYYLLHFRAFELLIGVLISLMKDKLVKPNVPLMIGAVAVLVFASLYLNSSTKFPGLAALLPTFGAALYVCCGLPFNKALHLNHIGYISYPLYLLHQPFIIILGHYAHFEPLYTFLIVSVTAGFVAYFMTRNIEAPIRDMVRTGSNRKKVAMTALLVFSLFFTALIGLVVAKSEGLPGRLKYINEFAYEVHKRHTSSFHQNFERGYHVDGSKRVLFVGDSALQQYVEPISIALNIEYDQVDTVTRGGCVLLKGTNFIDRISDIRCNTLRDKLYAADFRWDLVVISQDWTSYNDAVKNFSGSHPYERWSVLLQKTFDHFAGRAGTILVLGEHLKIKNTERLKASLVIQEEEYNQSLINMKISKALADRSFFETLVNDNVKVIHPSDLFCQEICVLHDGNWSYFSDEIHLTDHATSFVASKIGYELEFLEIK